MELSQVGVDADGEGDVLVVEVGDESGMGWLYRPSSGEATRVSVASLLTRDQYLWEQTPPTAPGESVRAAIQKEAAGG